MPRRCKKLRCAQAGFSKWWWCRKRRKWEAGFSHQRRCVRGGGALVSFMPFAPRRALAKATICGGGGAEGITWAKRPWKSPPAICSSSVKPKKPPASVRMSLRIRARCTPIASPDRKTTSTRSMASEGRSFRSSGSSLCGLHPRLQDQHGRGGLAGDAEPLAGLGKTILGLLALNPSRRKNPRSLRGGEDDRGQDLRVVSQGELGEVSGDQHQLVEALRVGFGRRRFHGRQCEAGIGLAQAWRSRRTQGRRVPRVFVNAGTVATIEARRRNAGVPRPRSAAVSPRPAAAAWPAGRPEHSRDCLAFSACCGWCAAHSRAPG